MADRRRNSLSEEELFLSYNPIDDLRLRVNTSRATPEQVAAGRNALAMDALSVIPGPGNALSAYDAYHSGKDAYNALAEGRYKAAGGNALLAGLSAAGAVFGLPIGKFAKGAAAAGKDTLHIFAGPTAKTADHGALAKAREMQSSGATRAEINAATGWDLGTRDGVPRFEISDANARVANPPNGNKLIDFYDHPELYKAYPDLAGVSVSRLDPDLYPNVAGSYQRPSPGNTEEFLFGPSSLDEWSTNPLHEAQHAIQFRESMAGGGNFGQFSHEELSALRNQIESTPQGASELARIPPEQQDASLGRWLYQRLAGEVEARNAQRRVDMSDMERRATPSWETQSIPDDMQILGSNAQRQDIFAGPAAKTADHAALGRAQEMAQSGASLGEVEARTVAGRATGDPRFSAVSPQEALVAEVPANRQLVPAQERGPIQIDLEYRKRASAVEANLAAARERANANPTRENVENYVLANRAYGEFFTPPRRP